MTTPARSQSELLTVAEAAQRLNRSTEQVRRYLREGRLKGQRVGGQWFINADHINQFLGTLRESQSFLDRVAPAHPEGNDPLGAIIGIGHGGGSNIAEGKEAYRRSFLWRY